MHPELRAQATILLASSLVLGFGARSFADDAEPAGQLNLADLAKYQAALAGKATADDARSSDIPAPVNFKDLWNRPNALRGRRVVIEGRVQRIFRQGPVGSFPALAEIWIASSAGDPYCLVIPQESGPGSSPGNEHDLEGHGVRQRIPKLGQTVRFTGTFLKMIQYAAEDGARLAPLVVGDQPPVPAQEVVMARRAGSFSAGNEVGTWTGTPINWLLGLTLALLAAGVLARQHLRVPMRRRKAMRSDQRVYSTGPDPPLVFVQPRDDR